jgi:hypothetical protein
MQDRPSPFTKSVKLSSDNKFTTTNTKIKQFPNTYHKLMSHIQELDRTGFDQADICTHSRYDKSH